MVIKELAVQDEYAKTFVFEKEGHTLGNILRIEIMKEYFRAFFLTFSPDVELCGYTIPHPLEKKMNLRVQTKGKHTAYEALEKGATRIINLCDETLTVFNAALDKPAQ